MKHVEERWRTIYDAEGKPVRATGVCHDITEPHSQREALRASEREFRTLAESMPQIVWVADRDGGNIYLNQNWFEYTGLSEAASVGHGWLEAIHEEDRPRTVEALQSAMRGEGDFMVEIRIRAADGSYRWWFNRAAPQRDEHGQVVKWFGTCTDIHDLKMADLEISRTNRALKMLGNCNEALIHAEDEADLLHAVCKIAVDVGGYKMAWIGYPQQDEAGSVKAMASCGDATGYLDRLKISWHDDTPAGHGPGGRVLRSGQPVLVRDVTTDPSFNHLALALEFDFRSVTALPLRLEGRTFGALFLYAPTVSEITETELKLLQELADDLAFGIGNLRSRNERAKLQSIVVKVAGAVSAATGAEFFEQLARNMAEALGAQASFVARLLPGEPATARSIAGVIDGQPADPLEFLDRRQPVRRPIGGMLRGRRCRGLLPKRAGIRRHRRAGICRALAAQFRGRQDRPHLRALPRAAGGDGIHQLNAAHFRRARRLRNRTPAIRNAAPRTGRAARCRARGHLREVDSMTACSIGTKAPSGSTAGPPRR